MSHDWFSTVTQIVLAVSAVLGAVAALLGVSTWRRELQGRTEYDLARRVLAGVYRVRDAIGRVRAPMMLSSEYLDRPDRAVDSIHADADDLGYAYQQRWTPLRESLTNLEVDLLEAEALWHDELRECSKQLQSCVSELFAAVWSYIRAKRPDPAGNTPDPKFIQNLERVIWPLGTDDRPDEYGEKLSRAVASFEKLLRPHLRR
jgi:hypothetical protein